jgi:hypothetical protein
MILPLEAVTADRPQPPPVYDNPPAIARRRGWLARLASRNASGRVSARPAPTAKRLSAG